MADCKEIKDETNGPQPPIIMKFDAPDESSENSANEMEGQSSEENSQDLTSPSVKSSTKIHCPVLSASRFGNSFGVSEFSSTVSKPKPAILRPSQLSAVTNNPGPSVKTVLQPAKFHNPFTKAAHNSTNVEDASADNTDDTSEVPKESSNEEKPEEDGKPKFLPLGASTKENENNVNSTVAPSASTPSFVFGQNLKERVTVANDTENSDSSEKEETTGEETSENGSSELMFSNAAVVCRSTSRPGLTLTEAAQELEEASRANKRKYSQVTLLTGEEGETNILQINCKLFAFDKATSSWQERGRGTLRLNDREEESRLVGRTIGTQRLVLNTKVWPGMTVERASPKSLRLTAMDVHGDIRIFIVQAAPMEVDQLHDLLMQRLKRAQERQPKKLATDH
ncbi:ran-binding protein 3 isoform X2 [Orussus abietinus]|uniref:ran-binding protein 3 isoform X2 n=1 Tax=Orussus abietinus TaxID=222816 RepID=UPI00062530D6|nr:ran-binding protein 3 isoform X2 [Orussus abietinus]